MPVKDYLSEHKRLIKMLSKSDKPQLRKEAKRQKLEVIDYLKKV